jgi:phosphoribosylglycinamide formyltransferase-1
MAVPALPSIVVLISGRGSNLRAIVQAQPPCRIAAVISNRHDAAGLAYARCLNCLAAQRGHGGFLRHSMLARFVQVVC